MLVKYGALFKLLLRLRRVEWALQGAWAAMRAADALRLRRQQAAARDPSRAGAVQSFGAYRGTVGSPNILPARQTTFVLDGCCRLDLRHARLQSYIQCQASIIA